MGEYNPNRPVLLGNEWPGISYEPYPIDVEVERGHTFRLDTSTTVVTGAFYLSSLPAKVLGHMTAMMSIYRAGTEAQTGPARKVIIPCNGGANISGTVTLSGQATSIADALAVNGDNKGLTYNSDPIEHSIFFDVGSFSSQLTGKRILNITFLYTAFGTPPNSDTLFFGFKASGLSPSPFTLAVEGGLEVSPEAQVTPRVSRLDLGNVNLFSNQGLSEPRKYPWRYQDLQRWALGGSPQITPKIEASGYSSDVTVLLAYAAIEVTYCEENRLAYGGRSPYPIGSLNWNFKEDSNIVHLRNSASFTPGVTLTPGEYSVMFGLGATNPKFDAGGKPVINALRQLYPISTHTGVQVVRTLQSGRTPVRTEIDVLPHLSLHTSSAVVTGVHGYGRLVSTPIYDSVNATQIILQQSGGTDVEYPYIRFYARRFGDTNVPLTVTDITTTLGSASITPAEFDALPEIIAGWKEVTLQLSVPSDIDNNDAVARYTWSATNLFAGNQWEILAVDAPGGLSAAQDVANATYAKTLGLTWNGNLDPSADVVVMIAQEPSPLTEFSVTQVTQELISASLLECIDPKCVPTGIVYNQLLWAVDGIICDSFDDRIEISEWGNTETGESWATSGGSVTDFNVTDDVATQSLDTVNVFRSSIVDTGETNFNVNTVFSWSITNAVGSSATNWIVGRYSDSQNYYCFRLTLTSSSGQVTAEIVKRVANTVTTLAAAVTVGQNIANDQWEVTFKGAGTVLTGEVRNITANSESITMQAVDFANSLTSGTFVGALNRLEAGNTNTLPVTVSYHRFAWALQTLDGGIELQRRDEVDTDWKTIMKSSSFCTYGFNDFEARVGVESFYRVRTYHTYDFYGEWFDVDGASTTLPAPGITGAENGNSILIFTSNERQDGSANLAYVMTWDNAITEDFTFPEADAVELRALYGRDYVMAFHPTERGGERFSRTMLVNNAGVATQRVRDGFRSLRDMAWTDLSYVCVRNELGDRWLAAVQVPSGKIQRNRRLYLARVDITEVTDTPTQVDTAG